jgi:cytochrome c2
MAIRRDFILLSCLYAASAATQAMIFRLLLVLGIFAAVTSAAAQDEYERGRAVYISSCQWCHTVGPIDPAVELTKEGPHLNDLFGRIPGDLPDPIYSLAMVRFGKDNIWDEATLAAFIRDPVKVVPGTNMDRDGISKDEDIKALLTFLATFDKDGIEPR